MSVNYSLRALTDLKVIAAYVSERSPRGAASVMRRINATVDLIGRHPGVGRRVRARKGVYVFPVGKYPYLVYYRIDGNDPIIVHVRHGARKLPRASEME
jgi:toxin ParE1/3/4